MIKEEKRSGRNGLNHSKALGEHMERGTKLFRV